MDVFVNYSCEYQSETGRVKLTFPNIDTTSIGDVKSAIQDAIQAPVCDQRLSYQGQMLTDDDIPLCRLYFREGDCFELHFLAAVDIKGMRKELNALKMTAKEIVEKLERRLPGLQRVENDYRGLWQFFHSVVFAVENITNDFFHPWKCLKSVAQRHFFVQEGGFETFMEVFKFSRQLYSIKSLETFKYCFHVLINRQREEITREDGLELRKWRLNRALLILQQYCLNLLWSFSERPQDREFVLTKRVLPLVIDALLLPYPFPVEDYALNFHPLDLMVVRVNEAAIGCFGGLVEQDSSTQELVSKTPQLIDKFLFVIHCACRGCPLGCAQHSLFSSQLAAITLFYCTFNVKSAQSFVDSGAVEKIVQITTNLFVNEEDYDTPLRYYCCLFLARIRSSPLVKLDGDVGVAVDQLIDMFLAKHLPSQISQWEESLSFVWVTMVPLVHLAFAAGKKWKNPADQTIRESSNVESQCAIEQSTQPLDLTTTLDASTDGENSTTSGRHSESLGRSDQPPWPGSMATQKLGIFSLVHMLSIEDNRQLALSENLLPYLVCLLWHLSSSERDKLSASLANFKTLPPPPLKIAAKSVLAFKNGLDVVYTL